MYKIVKNEMIKKDVYEIIVYAPNLVKEYKPGEFAIIMTKEFSERIPLSIYDFDTDGNVSFIYKVVGASTFELANAKDELFSVSGPYGNPSIILDEYKKYKRVQFIVNGITSANAYLEMKFLREKKVPFDVVYAYNRKNDIVIDDKIQKIAEKLVIIETEQLFEYLKKDSRKYSMTIAFGPLDIIKTITEIEKKKGNPILVNMHTIMVDGIGICGSCRIYDGGVMKLACQDGPEFRGENIDFNSSIKRNKMYKEEEVEEYKKIKKGYANE